jgi:hypothetical protein
MRPLTKTSIENPLRLRRLIEIAKIDELMSEQNRLIGLLKEECHSVISHAATIPARALDV